MSQNVSTECYPISRVACKFLENDNDLPSTGGFLSQESKKLMSDF